MNADEIKKILALVKNGDLEIDDAVTSFADLPYKDLSFAKIDNHRELRTGYPEVIYCEGKTPEQVQEIVEFMNTKDSNILGTRANPVTYEAVLEVCPGAVYHTLSRAIVVEKKKVPEPDTYIAVVTAGTADLPVAEEAVVTAGILGNRVELIADVGVAGIHRLFSKMDVIRGARVVIVTAGMEGALASVVGGVVDKPVIAVPTSVGYGASFNGLAPLLTMLNSCASGVSVVNIDNGFGAGYLASMINRL
ncbi:MAG: nickel pincer cofactor biosynthesis protein LarB [bacterium]|nr:nickel pincer cofactor biosynthesis protein LarB [bacterium]